MGLMASFACGACGYASGSLFLGPAPYPERRKALEPDGLPFGVVAMDGKSTAATAWDDKYAQRQPHSVGL